MKKIVGWKHVTGEFTDEKTGELKKFDNLNLYLICTQNSDPNLHGCTAVVEKIRWQAAEAVLGLPSNRFDELINKEVFLEYTSGRYPKLENVSIAK